MTTPQPLAAAARDLGEIFLKSCRTVSFLAGVPMCWMGWARLTVTASPSMLHWLVPLGVEGCTAYALTLWISVPRTPPRVHVAAWLLMALNAVALVAGLELTASHVHGTPALPLSLACAAPIAAFIATIVAYGGAVERFDEDEAKELAEFEAEFEDEPEQPEQPAPPDQPEGMIGHSVLGDLGAHAGNALTGTAVYRFFTTTRDLIYAGKSRNFPTRFKDHRREKPWFRDVHHMTVVWYDDEASALAAETQAIKTEGPRENVTHNPRRKPQ